MENERKPRLDVAVPDVFRREIGGVSARKFRHRLGAPEDLVARFELLKNLKKHRRSVNTVSFSPDGEILASGSADSKVKLWNWQTGKVKLRFRSGCRSSVLQANFMPLSDNRSIVISGSNGQVRHAQILDSGIVENVRLAYHNDAVHKLAIMPGSPHIFYSCGKDGVVQQCDLRSKTSTKLFTSQGCRPIVSLHAIEVNPRKPNLIAVGGSDQFARLFDLRSCKLNASTDFGQPVDYFCPPELLGRSMQDVTGLAFSEQSELLVSYNQNSIYLFDSNMGLGSDDGKGSGTRNTADLDHQSILQVYEGHTIMQEVKDVGFYGSNCEYVMIGSDCGRIFIWKKKGGQIVRVMQGDTEVVNCIKSHPHEPVLASGGTERDIKLWAPNPQKKPRIPKNVKTNPANSSVFLRYVLRMGRRSCELRAIM